MKCRFCQSEDMRVFDSRPTEDGSAIRRRRECGSCGRRFTTFERFEELPIVIVKKSGRREPFDREKIRNGIRKACEKRPIPLSVQDKLVNDIEKEICNEFKEEVTSEFVGELVMTGLKQIDEVSYVRFASVYRQFKDINTFMTELKQMLNDERH